MFLPSPSSADGDAQHAEPRATMATPSAQIEHVTVLLHGLRYGELDDGSQRRQLSAQLGNVLRLWTSGLLKADHGVHQVDAVARAFQTLVLTRSVRDLVVWTEVSVEVLDELVTRLCCRAKEIIDDLSHTDTMQPSSRRSQLPLGRVASLLAVVLHLVQCLFDDDIPPVQLPSCAIGAIPCFVYTATRLRLSVTLYPSNVQATSDDNDSNSSHEHGDDGDSLDDDDIRHTIQQLYAKFVTLRHLPSEVALIRHALPALLPLATSTIRAESAISVPRHTLRPLRLASSLSTFSTILDDCLHQVPEGATPFTAFTPQLPSLTSVFNAIDPAIDHADAETRVTALDIIAAVMVRMSDADVKEDLSESVAQNLADRLTMALIWHDSASTVRAVSLLVRILPRLLPQDGPYVHALSRPPPAAWERAVRALLAALEHHCRMERARDGNSDGDGGGGGDGVKDGDGDGDGATTSVETVASIGGPIVAAVGVWLMPRCTKTIRGIAEAFRRAAMLAARGDVTVDTMQQVAHALCATVAATWPRAPAYRAPVLSAVLQAVMEVERELAVGRVGKRVRSQCDAPAAVRDGVRVAGVTIIGMVAGVGADSAKEVRRIIQAVRSVADRYDSMKAVAQFLLEAEMTVGAGQGSESGKDVWFGPVVSKLPL